MMKKLLLASSLILLLAACNSKEETKVNTDPVVPEVEEAVESTAIYYEELDEDKKAFYMNNEILLEDVANMPDEAYLVYFHSPVCGYCDLFLPTLSEYEQLENSYPVYKLNLDIPTNRGGLIEYKVEGTPTLVLFENGEETWRVIGAVNLEDITIKN